MNSRNLSPLSGQRVGSIPEILLHIIGYGDASTLLALCLVNKSFHQIIKTNELQLAKAFFRPLYQGCGCDDLDPNNWPGKTVRDIQRVVHRHRASEKLATRLLEVHDPVRGIMFSVSHSDSRGDPARRRIQQGLCVFYSCGDIATEVYNTNFADLDLTPLYQNPPSPADSGLIIHRKPPSTLHRLREQILKTVSRRKRSTEDDDDGDSEITQREDLICRRHDNYRKSLTLQRQVSFAMVKQILRDEIFEASRIQTLDHLRDLWIHGMDCFFRRQTTRWFSLFLCNWNGRYKQWGLGVQEALEELRKHTIFCVTRKHRPQCQTPRIEDSPTGPSPDSVARRWLEIFYLRYNLSTSEAWTGFWPKSFDSFDSTE